MGRASRRKRGRVPETEPVWTPFAVVTIVAAGLASAALMWAVMKRYAPSWSAPDSEGGGGRTPADFIISIGGAAAVLATVFAWLPRLPRQPTGKRRAPEA